MSDKSESAVAYKEAEEAHSTVKRTIARLRLMTESLDALRCKLSEHTEELVGAVGTEVASDGVDDEEKERLHLNAQLEYRMNDIESSLEALAQEVDRATDV